jgi:hypothetical protein
MLVSFYTIDGQYVNYKKKNIIEKFNLPKLKIQPPTKKVESQIKKVIDSIPSDIKKDLSYTPEQVEKSAEPIINTFIIGKNFKFYDKENNLSSLQILDNNDICITRNEKTICLPLDEFIIKKEIKNKQKSKITK